MQGKSPTIACQAAPLAACVHRYFTEFTETTTVLKIVMV